MTKRHLYVIVLVLCLGACGKLFAPGPRRVLQKYLNALMSQNYVEAYKYLSSDDKSVENISAFLDSYDPTKNALASAVAKRTTYKVLKITTTGDNASANVEISSPDISSIFGNLLGAAFMSAFSGTESKSLEVEMAKKVQSSQIPMTTTTQTMRLVRQEDGWKVLLDLKAKKLEAERQAKAAAEKKQKDETIDALLAKARHLREERKFDEAIASYKDVLTLDEANDRATSALEKTEQEMTLEEEKVKYYQYLKIYDLKAGYYDSLMDGRIPGVEFKLRNNGSRSLDEVEVTVYFLGKDSSVISEQKYYPVLVSEMNFSGDNQPLKPKYIFQLEKGKFFSAKSVPSEWSGAVTAKVTDIKFSP